MIRKAGMEDLKEILNVYESARLYMKKSGNPSQWGDSFPPQSTVEEDIENETLYVAERSGRVCGVMEFHIGEEPYYAVLDEGSWIYSGDYATVHRLASDGSKRGVFAEFLEFGKGICPHIRIDTHVDNIVMQKLIEKHGFEKCGFFFSTPERKWIAYEKIFG